MNNSGWAPIAFKEVTRNVKPRFHMINNKLHVDHCEYIGEVVTDPSNTFAYDAYTLDLANVTSFPWGANIFTLFETAELMELDVIYKSLVGTSTTGAIEIGIDYDAADDVNTVSERALLNWEDTVETNSWNNVAHRSKRSNLAKFSRQRFTTGTGDDERFTSFGNVFVATTTSSLPSALTSTYTQATLGHLYFRYRVKLETPQLSSVGYLSGARPKLPQFLKKFATTAAISTGNNALSGITVADAPIESISEEPTGIDLYITKSNDLLQEGTVSTFGAVGSAVLQFAQDFQGFLTFSTEGLASLTSILGPTVTQYSKSNSTFSTGGDRPDLTQNVFDVLSVAGSTSGGTYSFIAHVVAQAGTYWRIAMPTYTALSGLVKVLGLNAGTRLGADKKYGDLLRSTESRRDAIARSKFDRPRPTPMVGPIANL